MLKAAASSATPSRPSQSSPPRAAPSSARSTARRRKHRRRASPARPSSPTVADGSDRSRTSSSAGLPRRSCRPRRSCSRYYERHRDALFRCNDDPDIPIDNSATEREFQNVAKLRLNMLFAGSTEGAHRACILLSIIATCRALGVPAQAYLAWAFDRLGTHRDVFGLKLEGMTPAAFKKTLG